MLKLILIGSIFLSCNNSVTLVGKISVVGNEPFTKYLFRTDKGNFYIDKKYIKRNLLYKKLNIRGEIVTIKLKTPNGHIIQIKKIIPYKIKPL